MVIGGVATPAQAATRSLTLRYGPIAMGDFNVALPKAAVRAPRVDGYIVGMTADLVTAHGRRVTIRDVMLHHVVFHRVGRRPIWPCSDSRGEAIYGTGEELQDLRLPPGYGYRVRSRDRWRVSAMLMSHSLRRLNVYIRYRVTVVTGRRLTAVEPFWLRANGCGSGISYPVLGDGGPGATVVRSYDWRVPFDGRIVAVGGHLHGGAKDLWMSQPGCGNRRMLDTAPRYGMPDHLYYRARPILHEPGPVDTRYFLSRSGIPVRRGESLRLTATYDNALPHPRVMAIMHVYIARASRLPPPCAPLPGDGTEVVKRIPVRTEPPTVRVPLNGLSSTGHTYTITTSPENAQPLPSGATVNLRTGGFEPAHISLPVGASLTWRFPEVIAHNVLFANGPRLLGSPTLKGGATFTTHFDVPGHYELFCYLHPMTMHQIVEVLP
jgi:plastocyanin